MLEGDGIVNKDEFIAGAKNIFHHMDETIEKFWSTCWEVAVTKSKHTADKTPCHPELYYCAECMWEKIEENCSEDWRIRTQYCDYQRYTANKRKS